MSDEDLEIRRGGVVAVDTETLRSMVRRLDALVSEVGDATRIVTRAMFRLSDDHRWESIGGPAIVQGMSEAADSASTLGMSVGRMADLYEYIELTAMADAAGRDGDIDAAAGYSARLERLREDEGGLGMQAWSMTAQRGFAWNDDFTVQALGAGLQAHPLWGWGVGAGASSLTGGLALWGRGTVGREQRLTGPPPPVTVRPVVAPAPASTDASASASSATSPSPVTAPAGLAAAVSRIPQGAAQVRVETYTMVNGSKQYAVYIAGTRAPTFGARDPFDLTSNVQLYDGRRSASYEAVRQALHQSGAGRGDIVHAFGHSQGAMIGGRVALENEFEVKTLATAGPPIEADVPETTLSVSIRHTDDPVAMLSSGGSAEGPGSPDSFIAERLADPAAGMHDLDLGVAHGLDVYAKTAEMVDASKDPRVDALRNVFAGLDRAVSVEVTEYVAERPDRFRAGGEG